jgi:hypothetical protein
MTDNLQTPETPNLKSWNWGAFFLTWIWGIPNGVYLGFSVFVAFVMFGIVEAVLANFFPSLAAGHLLGLMFGFASLYQLFMMVMHGLRGTSWSWERAKWRSAASFKRAQCLWAIGGLLFWVFIIGVFSWSFITATNSAIFKQSVEIVETSPLLAANLGAPVKVALTSLRGGVHNTPTIGRAYYKFRVDGAYSSAVVVVLAIKAAGKWHIEEELAVLPQPNGHNVRLLLYGADNEINFGQK